MIGSKTYGYDAGGQRRTVGGSWARTNLPAALASATYDANNQIATWAGSSFTYDANGNLMDDGARTYSWNARNQLVGMAATPNASFGYDGFGRRRTMTVGSVTRSMLFDGVNIIQEQSGGSVIANLSASLGIDEYLTRSDGAATLSYVADALGSAIALSDAAAAIMTEYTYEPFGRSSSAGSPTESTVTFTGREGDDTGLYYLRARYYDPQTQRFISEDPIRLRGGMNLFEYARNSPCQFKDPFGLKVTNCTDKPIYIKPEDGPIVAIPPYSEWDGGPDGVYPGRRGEARWTKTRSRPPLPPNDVLVSAGGVVTCTGGPCYWIPSFKIELDAAPDPTWEIPPGAPFVPPTTPLDPKKDCAQKK
jgi:RHS repeat-associated protein